MDKRSQAPKYLLDVRGQTGMTEEIARRAAGRAYGADDRLGELIKSIWIIGKDFDITISRIN